MRRLREHLLLVAFLLVGQHGAMLAVRMAAVCCQPSRPAASTMECCREGGVAHICPIKAKSSGDCRLRAVCQVETLGVAAGVWVGTIAPRVVIAHVLIPSRLAPLTPSPILVFAQRPPTPPPRG